MDATAAMGIASRRGLGKVKHIDTVFLWVQERIDNRKSNILKKHTSEMLADVLTKFLTRVEIEKVLNSMGFVYRGGAHGLKLTA